MNKQSLSINNPLSKLRYDVSRSCLSNPISYLLAINSPIIIQMTSNLGQGCAQSHAIWFFTMHCQFGLKYEIIMQQIKFRVPFVMRASCTKIPFLASRVKHMMVWWYITLWPQNTIYVDQPKSFIHYSQTVVNRSLTKPSKIHN